VDQLSRRIVPLWMDACVWDLRMSWNPYGSHMRVNTNNYELVTMAQMTSVHFFKNSIIGYFVYVLLHFLGKKLLLLAHSLGNSMTTSLRKSATFALHILWEKKWNPLTIHHFHSWSTQDLLGSLIQPVNKKMCLVLKSKCIFSDSPQIFVVIAPKLSSN